MMKAGVQADTISFNTVIEACAEAGEVARVEHWLSEMTQAGVEPDSTSYNTVVLIVVHSSCPRLAVGRALAVC